MSLNGTMDGITRHGYSESLTQEDRRMAIYLAHSFDALSTGYRMVLINNHWRGPDNIIEIAVFACELHAQGRITRLPDFDSGRGRGSW